MREGALPEDGKERARAEIEQHVGENRFQADSAERHALAPPGDSPVLQKNIGCLKHRERRREINPHALQKRLPPRGEIFEKYFNIAHSGSSPC